MTKQTIAPDALRRLVERAHSYDLHKMVEVANNNGTASEAAWERIMASPTYQRLVANLKESEAALEILNAR